MLSKNVILAVAGIIVAGTAYVGYAIYRKYPESNKKVVQDGGDE